MTRWPKVRARTCSLVITPPRTTHTPVPLGAACSYGVPWLPHPPPRDPGCGMDVRHSLVITPPLPLGALETRTVFPGYHPPSSLPLGALGTLRHARRALLAPGTGRMVPEALTLLCALASVPAADAQASVRGQEGWGQEGLRVSS